MIITVTTSTITTVTTVTAMGLTAAISIAAVASLIFFLAIKELANARGSGISSRIARSFNLGILPLMMAFAIIIVIKIAEVIA